MELFKNTFEKGMNLDIEAKRQPPGTYRDAARVRYTTDSEYLSMAPMKGSVERALLTELGDVEVLASCNVEVRDGANLYPCAMIFYAPSDNSFRVSLFREDNGLIYNIYTETNVGDIKNFHIDAIVYAEGGTDIVYFNNPVGGIGKIVCDNGFYSRPDSTPLPLLAASPNLSKEYISLLRYSPDGVAPVARRSASESGSLMCGAYQFAYRLCNVGRNQYTKWSMLSYPTYISQTYFSPSTFTSYAVGGIGSSTEKAIDIDMDISDREAMVYDHVQICVVENTDGSRNPATFANVMPPVAITAAERMANAKKVVYYGDEKGTSIPIDDIVVESADIDKVGTLAISKNTLIAGNITYKGYRAPSANINVFPIPSYSVRLIEDTDEILDEDFSKQKRGYFRGEVYRFGITYVDEEGNWSPVQVLDMSQQSDNSAATGCIDFKFPDRRTKPILTDNNGPQPRKLGLRFEGISNHPEWAKGFAIVRAKRKKNILFQSPVIPTMMVEGAMASQEVQTDPYPGDGQELPSVYGVTAPKNMFNPFVKHILRGEENISASRMEMEPQEVTYFFDYLSKSSNPIPDHPSRDVGSPDNSMKVGIVYPEGFIYNNALGNFGSYTSIKGSDLRTVDVVLPRRHFSKRFFNGTYNKSDDGYGDSYGTYVDTEILTVLKATQVRDFYFRETVSRQAIATALSGKPIHDTTKVKEYQESAEGTTIASEISASPNFELYEELDGSISEGYRPFPQKCAVVVGNDNIGDIAHYCVEATVGSDNGILKREAIFDCDNGSIKQADFPMEEWGGGNVDYESDLSLFHGPGYTPGHPFTGVRIANMEAGLSDFRYGGRNDFHEFIFTGAFHSLTEDEVANNTRIQIDVWGGDCEISKHVFKVHDSNYYVPNSFRGSVRTSPPEAYARERDGRMFGNASDDSYVWRRPIPYKAGAAFLEVWLENEVNGDYVSDSLISKQQRLTSQTYNLSPNSWRVKPGYEYNFAYSLEPMNKVWFVEDIFNKDVREFRSRIAYSSKKVYQADVEGFDEFPANNIYDLDETFGDLSKLHILNDALLAFQERAISYIPVESQVLETADASTLSVRSQEFIGVPRYLSTIYGTLFPSTVRDDGMAVYFYDGFNRVVGSVRGSEVGPITDSGLTTLFRNANITKASGCYDTLRREYILRYGNSSYADSIVVNTLMGSFMSRHNIESKWFHSGDALYIIGYDGSGYVIHEMEVDDQNYGVILNDPTDPFIEYIANPAVEVPSTFDNYNLNSKGRLTKVDFYIDDDLPQSSTSTLLDIPPLENTYRIKTLRDDVTGSRLRGTHLRVKLYWNSSDDSFSTYRKTAILHGTVTKYRESKRKI